MTWLERVRLKNLPPYESGSDKSAESHNEETSGTFVTTEVVGHEVFMGTIETIVVAYQRFFLDYDLPDGTYTPQELHKAKLLVKHGPILRYRLRWPVGTTQPITIHVGIKHEPSSAQQKGS